MLLGAAGLRPVSLLDELARRHPDRVGPGLRRTLERRVAEWKALHGAERDVMFRQVQQPGRMELSDFTDASDLGVVVVGRPLEHRLYHFALAYSGFEHVEIVLGGESFAALASGRERTLRLLGGATREHRSDSLSAAFRNLAKPNADDPTRRFEALVAHFIAARYERRSQLITANQPFGAWDTIFPDPAMTVAAIDRLVHHSVILEMNTDSYRRKSAEAKRPGR